MADVFSLMGKVAVEYRDAVSGLEEVNSAAENTANKMDDVDSAADETGNSLNELGDEAEGAGSDIDELGDEADSASSDIDDLGSDADSASSDIDDLGDSADSASSDIDDLGSDADSAAGDIDGLGSSADSASSDIDALGDSAGSASGDMSDLTGGAGELGESFSSASGFGGEFGGVLQTFMTGGIIAGVTALIGELVKQLGDLVSGFQESKEIIAMGTGATGEALTEMTQTAQDAYSQIAKASSTSAEDVSSTLAELNTRFGLTGDELEGMTVKMQNFADVTGQEGSAAVDDIANMYHYWGLEMDDIPGLLDDIVTASQGCQADASELQAALSDGAGAFQAMGYSTEEALAFLWEYSDTGGDVSEVTQAMTKANSNLASVTDDVPGAFQAAIEAMADCNNTTEALNAEVGDTGLTVEDVFGKKVAQKMAQNIQSGNSSLQEFEDMLEDNEGALDDTAEAVTSTKDQFAQFGARLKSDIGGVISPALQTLGSGFVTALNTVMDFCEHPIESLKTLWKNVRQRFGDIKENISENMEGAREKVHDKLEDIGSKFTDIMGGAKETVSGAIEKIKGFFDFDWSLPEIKMPHFSIEGNFSLNPPSIPHFSVEWYAKAMEDGMIMNDPTVFGFDSKTNQLLAGGEAGSETVVGTESLMNMIREASGNNSDVIDRMDYWFAMMYNMMTQYFPEFADADIRLNDDTLVGRLTPKINKELGKLNVKGDRQVC